MPRYAKPKSVDEALSLLGEGRWCILSGGTDFYPAQGTRPIRDDVLDIGVLGALRGIVETQEHWVIGACTTWTDIVRADLPPAFRALQQAAREVGSIQIQNTGTVAGNLCNASPAADGVPPLLALDAAVEILSSRGARLLPLSEFILGNRRTALETGDLVTAVHVPKASVRGMSCFVKLGARRYLVISIAMAAARIHIARNGTITDAAVAVGSCSAVARRLGAVEAALKGLPPSAVRDAVLRADMPELAPIGDVRASAEYRLEAAREIVCRAIEGALSADAEAMAA